MSTTVLLIRHGQTDWNAEQRLQGSTDVPLNDAGIRQARLLAARITQWPVTALYSSPMIRAKATAQILGEALGLEPRFQDEWREMHFGRMEGLTPPQVRAQFPEIFVGPDQPQPDPPGGETRADVTRRTSKAYARLLISHPDQTVAVVSHGSALRQLVTKLFNVSVQDARGIAPHGNTAVTVLEVSSHGLNLVMKNDTSHLDGV